MLFTLRNTSDDMGCGMSAKRSSTSSAQRLFIRILTPSLLLLSLPWLMMGCNDYPLQLLIAKPYTEITDSLARSAKKAVDILFVVDNSDSMKEEQDKLVRNFDGFIKELTSRDVGDYQIAIISTDMFKADQRGKFQGTPRIIKGNEMSIEAVKTAFKANILLGTGGYPFEKPLDAVQAALSPALLNDKNANAGFLRKGALLAIIFVGDEDDCSHNGNIQEGKVISQVCFTPKSQVVLGDDGKPYLGVDSKPLKGNMEDLHPVKKYADFLRSLNRQVLVAGLIGDPVAYKDPKSKKLLDPPSGCTKDLECQNASTGDKHVCAYRDSTVKKVCGGCVGKKKEGGKIQDAAPGFRLYELIKEFGGSDNWFPICGDDQGFQKALLRFAGAIIDKLNFVVLTRVPLDPTALTVKISYTDGRPTQTIPAATKTGVACPAGQDTICGANGGCGPDNQCYQNGWIYFFTKNQPKLKLVGSAKAASGPGSKVSVIYASK